MRIIALFLSLFLHQVLLKIGYFLFEMIYLWHLFKFVIKVEADDETTRFTLRMFGIADLNGDKCLDYKEMNDLIIQLSHNRSQYENGAMDK